MRSIVVFAVLLAACGTTTGDEQAVQQQLVQSQVELPVSGQGRELHLQLPGKSVTVEARAALKPELGQVRAAGECRVVCTAYECYCEEQAPGYYWCQCTCVDGEIRC